MLWLLVTIFFASLSLMSFVLGRYGGVEVIGVPADFLIGTGMTAVAGLVWVAVPVAAPFFFAIALGPIASYVALLSRGMGMDDAGLVKDDDGDDKGAN